MKTLKKTLAVLMAVLMLFSTMVIASAAEGDTVAYFVNTDNWAEVVAHVWVDGGEVLNQWPGEACTLVEGTDNVYAFDMTTGNRIIFNNNGAGAQSDNLNSEDAIGKYYEPKTKAFYATAEEAIAAADAYVPVQPSGDANTVYFVNTVNWEAVYGHVWGGTNKPGTAWPGDALTAEGNVYAYDIYDSTGLIFNAGDGMPQTDNIDVTADIYGKYYEFTTNAWYASAEEAVAAYTPAKPTDPPKTEKVTFEPTPLDKMENMYFVVAGDEALCGSSWEPTDRNNELVYNEETRLYEKTYNDVADGTYGFKVTTDGGWDNADFNLVGDAKFGGPDAKITVTEAGSTVKIVFDYQRAYVWINDVQVEAEVPVTEPTDPSDTTPTEAPAPVYFSIIGNINGADVGMESDWESNPYVCDANGQVTITFEADSYLKVKTSDNKTWYGTEAYVNDSTTATMVVDGAEKLFVPAGTYTITVVANEDGTITVSYAEATVAPTNPTDATEPTDEPTEPTTPTEPAKKMTAKATAKKIAAGKTATVKVENNEGKVTYKTSDKKVAKVSANGVVTALTKGKVTITATDKAGNTATVKITVKSSPKLSKKTAKVAVKKSTTITVKGAATKVTVTKCNVAKFKVKGDKITVTGKKAGKATVNVKVNGTTLKLTVNVTKKK